jgi:Arc/MetJ family transcription regulator
MMRTNITIDEKLMTQAQSLTGITTKKAVVDSYPTANRVT